MSVPFAIPTLKLSVALASWIGFQWAGAAYGTTLRVPSEYPTIQAALDAAAPTDTVLVAPGTYSGDGNRALTFRGKDLVLLSEGGASTTVIECQYSQGVIFHQGKNESAIVDGFTLDECIGWPGGAFSFMNASPTIKNCIVQQSGTTGTYLSRPAFFHCDFRNNRSSENGGAITVDFLSTMLLEGCTFQGNLNHSLHDGGGIYVGFGSEATIRDCLIVKNASANDGGGLYVAGSVAIERSTISDNCAFGMGGAIYVTGEASIENSILSFNTNYLQGCGNGSVVASCTDVFGNEGGDWIDCLAGQEDVRGNLSLDPLYCDWQPSKCWESDSGKYQLDSRSPCAPEGSGGCGLIGALPVACGATAIEEGTWGQVKARFQGR